MVALINRSIDLMEELAAQTANRLRLNRRGYLYLTADPEHAAQLARLAQRAAEQGAGPLRVHGSRQSASYRPSPAEDFDPQLTGCDLLTDRGLILEHFPYLTPQVHAALHVRRAGWFSGQQLGMILLERSGARRLQGRVTAVERAGGAVCSVRVRTADGEWEIRTPLFIIAAGPFLDQVAALLGERLPIAHQLHLKVALRDPQRAVPRQAPLLIWDDPQRLPWSPEEREVLAEDPQLACVLGELPGGAHLRPEGGVEADRLLLLWPYHPQPAQPSYPLPTQPLFPEVVLRGMVSMIPGLGAYLQRMPRPYVDGGYYTHTPENRPLIGPLAGRGAYVLGALSGFGLMAACGAGELLAAHVAGEPLPPYAAAFSPARYQDPSYLERMRRWGPSLQL